MTLNLFNLLNNIFVDIWVEKMLNGVSSLNTNLKHHLIHKKFNAVELRRLYLFIF